MRIRKILYGAGAGLLLLIVLIIDVIRKSVDIDIGGLHLVRNLLVVASFILVYRLLELFAPNKGQSGVKRMGAALVAAVVLGACGVAAAFMLDGGFDTKNNTLLPLGYGTLFLSTIISFLFAVFAIGVLRLLRDLALYKRRKGSQRNLLIFMGLLMATCASTLFLRPLDSEVYVSILYGFAVVAAVVNSFRLSWIVYLTKREKVFGLVYGFFLFAVFTLLNVLIQSGPVGKGLLYYSYPMREFISLVFVFANIYFGMAFVSTLFHLPTAEAFDRKSSEVTSLHTLGKLVTQAYDFNELIDTVTSMTLQVCEAKGCWIELIQTGEAAVTGGMSDGQTRNVVDGTYHVRMGGTKNITTEEIDLLVPSGQQTIRDEVLRERRPIVIDDIRSDQRFSKSVRRSLPAGSLVVVPLILHAEVIGVLYATKDTEHGFFKDDVDVISAFADQATIAIENSRLFTKSVERERLIREMMLAQEMQRKLLPQALPEHPCIELAASSTPAFEVGGDYYDVIQIDAHRFGVIVGDVSGKGMSAAFYMSEVKGIFQALGRMYESPKDFIVKANDTLYGSFDKRSFISLIYAIVDVQAGRLTLARAGHCPLLHISGEKGNYIRPSGIGIGLGGGAIFASSIEEHAIHLKEDDVCLFYTDGVTEARSGDDEFGYDRLLDAVMNARRQSAVGIKQHLLDNIKVFTNDQSSHDDLTLVVMKWRGMGNSPYAGVS